MNIKKYMKFHHPGRVITPGQVGLNIEKYLKLPPQSGNVSTENLSESGRQVGEFDQKQMEPAAYQHIMKNPCNWYTLPLEKNKLCYLNLVAT